MGDTGHRQVRAHPPAAAAGAGARRDRHRLRPGARIHAAVLRPGPRRCDSESARRRTPFWTPADELRLDAEALTLAESLFPERPNENSFFSDAPRRIMAFLLTHRPDAAQIVAWLSDPRELDRLLAGTPYAVMIDPSAGPQRAGVLAS